MVQRKKSQHGASIDLRNQLYIRSLVE